MKPKIKIAVDAMGGENSPKKVINGILENYKANKDIIYNIFGDKEKIELLLPKNYDYNVFNVTNTKNKILDTDSPLSAAKKGKDTSMWLTIQSVKNKESDVAISAGNTGALFVISKYEKFQFLLGLHPTYTAIRWRNLIETLSNPKSTG